MTPLPLDLRRVTALAHRPRVAGQPALARRRAESVAIFSGPHTYISPSFYATKAETGKVVPTWNYEVLNVYGRLVIHDDPDWVLNLVTMLTNRHEAAPTRAVAGRPTRPKATHAVAATRHRRRRARHRQSRRQGQDVAEPTRPEPGRRRRRPQGVRRAARISSSPTGWPPSTTAARTRTAADSPAHVSRDRRTASTSAGRTSPDEGS